MNGGNKDNRCDAEATAAFAIVPSLGMTTTTTTGAKPTPTTPISTADLATMDTSNCPCHCQTTTGDNDNEQSNSNNLGGEPFSFPISEEVRWFPPDANQETNFETISTTAPVIFSEEIINPFIFNNPNDLIMSEITITIEEGDQNQNEYGSENSNTTRLQMQTHEDIAQVLENFNSILDSIDLTYDFSSASSSVDLESGRDLDLGLELNDNDGDRINDEEEFLIIVDSNNRNEDGPISGFMETVMEVQIQDCPPSPSPEEQDPDADPEEGYESDRPMVRASMRKLKPVQMLPMPNATNPQSQNQPQPIIEYPSPNHQTTPGFATTLNSPVTNKILVASLVNTLLSPGYNDAANTNAVANGNAEHNYNNNNPSITITTGSRSQCHSRSPSHNNNPLVLNNGNASDLTAMNTNIAVIDLVDVPDNFQTQNQTLLCTPLHSRLSNNSVHGLNSSITVVSGDPGMNVNLLPESQSTDNLCPPFETETESRIRINVPAEQVRPTLTRDTSTDDIFVETIRITEAVMIQSSSTTENSSTPTNLSNTNPEIIPTATLNSAAAVRRRSQQSMNSPGGVSPGRWPHRLSSVLALIGCTLGLNNICRFGLLSVEYGTNFTIQFILLSLVFGIPLLTFHMSSGQYLASGIIDMWKISPIFQGIGIALVISQAMIGVYTAVGVSWMFIYFRDSFITRYDLYRWAKCFRDYRECDQFVFNSTQLSETVPDYFNGVVLQRSSSDYPSSTYPTSSLKFTVAFNLAVVWMLVFVSLSKGLKSYGKAIHGFVLVPVAAILVLASKMVGLVPSEETGSLFGQTAWSSFFFNSQTWVIAAREAFFTWGILGCCVMQVTSHNRPSHSLKSDASIVILITTFVLLLSAFLGNACYSVLVSHGYTYISSSFESEQTYKFLIRKPPDNLLPSSMNYHTSFLMGVRIVPPSDMPNGNTVSGYQVLRLATELFPATMAALGSQGLSPFWTVLFYFTFILFGIAQQLAIWYCVIKGVIAIKAKALKSWETTITFFVCGSGFLLGLPLCTESGIFVEYFLDYAIGSGWWIMVLYLLELVAVFIVRGAPYCGENIVTVLMTGRGKLTALLAPLISFLWNVILPVAMLVLSIISFKSGNIRELYDWNPLHGYAFWPSWTRELGTLIQLLPILTVPFVAIVQSCRYLTNGPPDLFDRMQQLYRPHSRGLLSRTLSAQLGREGIGTDSSNRNGSQNRTSEDPPPKYTPPPSYSTATSARIAKFLRTSLRRSLRRLPGGSQSSENLPPPPNYASVILEINSQNQQPSCSSTDAVSISPSHPIIPILISPPASESHETGHSSNEKSRPVFKINVNQSHTLGRDSDKARGSLRRIASDITPREVARILRASFRQDDNKSDISNENANKVDNIHQGNELGPDHLLLATSSSGFPKNYNFNFSQKRRSNDSQLALISSQSRNNSLGSNDLPFYADLMNLGIINPNSFQFSENHLSSDNNRSNDEIFQGPGHFRSSSLTVPSSYHSEA